MAGLLILFVIVATSAGAYAVGAHSLGLRRASLRAALGKSLECIGVAFIFMVANTVFGVILVLSLRAFGPSFVSLYAVADPTIGVLSVVQAVAFQWWLASRERAATHGALQ